MSFKRKSTQNISAFTLVELIVTLSLIIVVISLTTINYNASYSDSNLNNAQNSLYQNIKLAQSYALSYRAYDQALPVYWGIYLSAPSTPARLFADLNGNGFYDGGEGDLLSGGREIPWPDDIVINSIKGSNSGEVSDLYIMFALPSGDLYAYNSTSSDPNSVEDWMVELGDSRFPMGKVLKLSYPGLIDSQRCSCNQAETWCCSFCLSTTTCLSY